MGRYLTIPAGDRTTPEAEFDRYAEGYDDGGHHALWQLAGKSAENFMQVKAAWLAQDLQGRPPCGAADDGAAAPLRLLDFGCGTGGLLKQLRRLAFDAELRGCDISRAMLAEAEANWNAGDGPLPPLDLIADGRLPYADASFHVVVTCAVLHHVAPAERDALFAEVRRVLAPAGRFYVFEHNPYNPVTQFVVQRAAVDRNAVLLAPREVRARMRRAGLGSTRCRHLMFFPPRWRWAAPIERLIRWLPLGGQYVVTGSIDPQPAVVAGTPAAQARPQLRKRSKRKRADL